jgi:L-seryl-tRNA(Ser) seleniumtransferase
MSNKSTYEQPNRDGQENSLRMIPAVDKLIYAVEAADCSYYPRHLLINVVRRVLDSARQSMTTGRTDQITMEELIAKTKHALLQVTTASLKPVINATGVVLHTNLGRAPVSRRAQTAVNDIMGKYSSLEYELATGERGTRYEHVAEKLSILTGGEDVLVVNNNAAALLLMLTVLARGKEVIVSRGQLVEIGGSFRIPAVMEQSGAKLVEVGTTNKTRLSDYQEAINSNTAAILKVHTSNFRIVGFTAQPDDAAMIALGRDNKIPIIEDLGSGFLGSPSTGLWQEPSVNEQLAKGFDLVFFSGDKLLGAGQAGIIAGNKHYIGMAKKHPLLRALRIDKLSLAALEGTLLDYIAGEPRTDVPIHRMLNASPEELRRRAEQLTYELASLQKCGWEVRTDQVESQAGGGALPTVGFQSWGVSVGGRSFNATIFEHQLRGLPIPIIARIHDNRVIFDIRCLDDQEMTTVRDACLDIAKLCHRSDRH